MLKAMYFCICHRSYFFLSSYPIGLGYTKIATSTKTETFHIRVYVLHNLEIVQHMCTISRLHNYSAQSQDSENRNVISRLRKFSNCTENIYNENTAHMLTPYGQCLCIYTICKRPCIHQNRNIGENRNVQYIMKTLHICSHFMDSVT